MSHANPLPQLVPMRLDKVLQRVREQVWSHRLAAKVRMATAFNRAGEMASPADLRYRDVKPGTFFGDVEDPWRTVWFKVGLPTTGQLPRGQRYLHWSCQGESNVYVHHKPYAGLDCAHPQCALPGNCRQVDVLCGTWNTGIWLANVEPILRHGLRFDGAELRVRNETAWRVFCDLEVLRDLARLLISDENLTQRGAYLAPLEICSPLLRVLLHELDQACDVFEANGLDAFGKALRVIYRKLPAHAHSGTTALIGHAHIDLVWLWPEAASQHKTIHTFATMARLLDRHRGVVFCQSQPAMNRWMDQLSPDTVRQVRRLIKAGRWELLGGFEVEPDVNLPCGEALLRSLRLGQTKIEAMTGKRSDICWLPDVFGYSQCLPQILRHGGIRYFFTTKMNWSTVSVFPYTSFVWRGGDGSEVLAHLSATGYNETVNLAENRHAIHRHRQMYAHEEVLIGIGYGDGGGGMTEQMAERAARCADLAGVPRAKWSRASDFFHRLDAARGTLPVYQGELYLEYHRGTYTTRSDFKQAYRSAEIGMLMHEAAAVAVRGKASLDDRWQHIAMAQFHDALPGSSIPIVYEQLTPRLRTIREQCEHDATRLLSRGRRTVVFNPLPIARQVTVRHAGRWHSLALGALEAAPLDNHARTLDHAIMHATSRRLCNGLVDASFHHDGNLLQFGIDGQRLALIDPVTLRMFSDDPAQYDAWDIDHYSSRTGVPISPGRLRVVERCDHRAVLRSDLFRLGQSSGATLSYILEAGSRYLRIELDVDWHEHERLLRLHAPTDYRGRTARYGCPFGAIDRPQQPGREADEAMWEVPGSRWAAACRDDGEGLALLTEAKYGFSCREGDLGVSLLRGSQVMYPPTMPAPAGQPRYNDQGRHCIRLAIGRHEPAAQDGTLCTAAAADALFTPPLIARRSKPIQPLLEWSSLGGLVPCWISPATTCDGYVIRLHETAGSAGSATLALRETGTTIHRVNLFEQPLHKIDFLGRASCQVDYQPLELISLLVRRG